MNNVVYAILLTVLVLGSLRLDAEPVKWFDGSIDKNGPPGKLLSDNAGYWGDCVLTGADYSYEVAPDVPADIYREDASRFGNRLLDGYHSGNWWAPVGAVNRPIIVTFDLKRLCILSEIDIITKSKKVNAKIEISKDNATWQSAAELKIENCVDSALQRIKIPSKPSGRYVKLTVDAGGTTYLDQVMIWGDADASDKTPEYLKPTQAQPIANGIALEGIPGIPQTAVTDMQYFEWQVALGSHAKKKAVWSALETWGPLTAKPILPKASIIDKPLEIIMARNETECVAFALTNTAIHIPAVVNLRMSKFKAVTKGLQATGLTGELRVGGAIPSRWYGTVIGPLFSEDNLLGDGLMQRYLTNGAGIMDFPKVTLSAAGSAVFWVSVKSDMSKPGTYEAKVSYGGGNDQVIRVKVLDVKLPPAKLWLESWSDITGMFPFEYTDRMERDVAYKSSLGLNVWGGWPEKGSPAEKAKKYTKPIYDIFIGDYGHQIYNSAIKADQITPEVEKNVEETIRGFVKKAKEVGLTYNDWYVQLTDEPGKNNAEVYGAFAKLVKKIDPKVNLYCNPSFWVGFENGGVSPDKEVYDAMSGWYNECIDVSCPLLLHLDNRPESFKLFNHKRLINAFYNVSSHHAKSERRDVLSEYRKFAWTARSLDWNGWGFYSYYGPRGNPWNDFDIAFMFPEDLPDYQVVYPGPRGPVPTRNAEAGREGWEDYRLLTMLQKQKPDVYKSVMKSYKEGKDVEKLRLTALQALAKK